MEANRHRDLSGAARVRAARAWLAIAAVIASASTGVALAQVALPPVQVPGVPSVDLPVDVNRTLSDTTDRLDPNRLTDARLLKVRQLIRAHRDVLEADPHGAAIVRSELLAFSPSAAALEHARAAGFSVARERALAGLDARIVVLRAPAGMSTQRALKKLRSLDPQGAYDFNHVYTDSGAVQPGAAPAVDGNPAEGSAARVKIGLIDGGVDLAHPVFHDASIAVHGCSGRPVVSAHGTAVASLMVGRSEKFHGAAPGAALYAADVYCGVPTGGAVDAVADALAWLARERVPIINVSLVGPANVSLENIVRIVVARGHLIVAAVGNDGPAAPALYPAAYPGVVGVTAIDARQRVLLEAARGPQVDFAAPGADIAAASVTEAYAAVRGTSFASPIVAGLLVAEIHEPDPAAAERALATLARLAIDRGAPGVDPTYGHGVVGDALRIELATTALLGK
ncbi:MAG TPA: S8 family serine peptidase [Steroidobacteraceae bacterium]|nr:S8 family serine peptidase [Steroidobacteraceae bacterium]